MTTTVPQLTRYTFDETIGGSGPLGGSRLGERRQTGQLDGAGPKGPSWSESAEYELLRRCFRDSDCLRMHFDGYGGAPRASLPPLATRHLDPGGPLSHVGERAVVDYFCSTPDSSRLGQWSVNR